MHPYDDFEYDPIAEGIGWFVRSCAGVEIWLAIVVSNVCDLDYAKVEREKTAALLKRLAQSDPTTSELGERITTLFAIRHGVVHGYGDKSEDRQHLRTELRNRDVPSEPKVDHFDRPRLVDLAERATSLRGELQAYLTEWANSDDRE